MKDDIDKITEQIESIQRGKKKNNISSVKENEEKQELVGTDTKKIDDIKDLEVEDNSPVEIEKEDTKQIETVDVSEKEEKVEESSIIETEDNPTKNDEIIVEEKKNSNKILLYVLIGIVSFLIIVLLVSLLLVKKSSTQEDSSKKGLSLAEQEKIITNYGTAVNGVIGLYLEKKELNLTYDEATQLVDFEYDVYCEEHEVYEDGSLFLNGCTIDGKKTKASYGTKQVPKEVIIPDGAIKVYVPKSGGAATFDEPKDVTKYDVYGVEIKEAYSDISFLDAKKSDYIRYIVDNENFSGHIVNYKTGEKAANNISYDTILAIHTGEKQYDTKYAAIGIKNGYSTLWEIVNIIDGTKVNNFQYNSLLSLSYSNNCTSGPQYFIETVGKEKLAAYHTNDHTIGIFNYTNGQEIIPFGVCAALSKSGDYLFCRRENQESIVYDNKGRKLFENAFDKIYWLVDGKFLLVQDGSNIKLTDMNGKELYNYGKYSFPYANFGLSYDNGALFQFTNNTMGNDYDYDMDESCIEFIYHGETKKGEVKKTYCGGIAKPILYLYPEKETKVTVQFEHPEYLETTYPKFVDRWDVTASPNGDLIDSKGKYYYGLYWDEKKVHTVDFSTGFYVEKNQAIDFLEDKLTKIGLNNKERNEFIMYWLPILEKNEKSLVYFELTEEREAVNKLFITPKPKSLLRVVIHVKKVNKETPILEEKIPSFKRKGFTAVEWGGTTY